MEQVKDGDVVRVHYTGKLTNGEQFDSSEGREPLEFTVGAGQMIKGFDDAMPGMSVGEKKTINILPAPYHENLKCGVYEENKGDDPLIETFWKYCEILPKEIFHVANTSLVIIS